MHITGEMLFNAFGDIDEVFITEAGFVDKVLAKISKNKKTIRYGAAGIAVSVGMAMAYIFLKPKRENRGRIA